MAVKRCAQRARVPGLLAAAGWRCAAGVPAAMPRCMSTALEQRYGAMIASGELMADPIQQTAIQRLADVQALIDAELASPFVRKAEPEPESSGWGGGWFASKPEKPPLPPDPLAVPSFNTISRPIFLCFSGVFFLDFACKMVEMVRASASAGCTSGTGFPTFDRQIPLMHRALSQKVLTIKCCKWIGAASGVARP
jgi:hypothetical protein